MDLHFAHTHFGAPCHFFLSLSIALHETHGVEVGSFCSPQGNIVEVEIEGVLAEGGVFARFCGELQ